jgi:hypothetical protein
MSVVVFENENLELLFELKGVEPSSKIHRGITSRESMQHRDKSTCANRLGIPLMEFARTVSMLTFPEEKSDINSDFRLSFICKNWLGDNFLFFIRSAAIDTARG